MQNRQEKMESLEKWAAVYTVYQANMPSDSFLSAVINAVRRQPVSDWTRIATTASLEAMEQLSWRLLTWHGEACRSLFPFYLQGGAHWQHDGGKRRGLNKCSKDLDLPSLPSDVMREFSALSK